MKKTDAKPKTAKVTIEDTDGKQYYMPAEKPETAKVTIEMPFGWEQINSAYAWRKLKAKRRNEEIEIMANPSKYPCLVKLKEFIGDKHADYLFLYIVAP